MTIRKGVRLLQVLLILTLPLLFSGSGFATPINVDAVQDAITSADMTSMEVNVFTSDGKSYNFNWNDNGVSGDWGNLVIGGGDTYAALWTLTENSGYTITSITLTGNNVIFDIYFEEYLTTGSNFGFFGTRYEKKWTNTITGEVTTYEATDDWVGEPITLSAGTTVSGTNGGMDWEFFYAVALKNNDPEYDLWNTLVLDFDESVGVVDDGVNDGVDVLTWYLDTDLAVPEPTTFLLFGLGLLGMGAMGRRA